MRRAVVLIAALTFIVSAGLLRSSEAASGQDVILLHGWRGTVGSWDTARPRFEADGDTVHVLPLPRNGDTKGDTIINADYVRAYISDHGLTNVKLVGHSLGGTLAVFVALGCHSTFTPGDAVCTGSLPAVTSVVQLDSGYGGIGCWIVPDLCSSSTVMSRIKAIAPTALPVLALKSDNETYPHVDCRVVYTGLDHNAFQTTTPVLNQAAGWPETNPCGPTSIPTPTPSPTPCSWWDRLRGRC